jgi:aminoglycoside phosphotransferase (APT) family kinase protein/GrpB-like predicted nucleotidyltransferase (UPF0157 family)
MDEQEFTPKEEMAAARIGPLKVLGGPVILVDYDPSWPTVYEREAVRIRDALGGRVLVLEHAGSTAVPGLAAKPKIDIVLAVPDSSDEVAYVPALEAAGYVLRAREPDWHEHRLLRRFEPKVNLHVFSRGCPEIERMLRFRDHLRRDDADRRLYEETKRELAPRTWKYTQHYADAKTKVVEEILARAAPKMHADEVDTDPALVSRLIASQFPHWAELPIERVGSSGTDNALYRLGDELVVRLPRIEWAVGGIEKEFEWLPELAPRVPAAIPMPLAKGVPALGYPWEWGVYTWLEGENPAPGAGRSADGLVDDAARFIRALHAIDLAGGPPARRGAPVRVQDERARAALADLEGSIDVDAATRAWEAALEAPPWAGTPVWVHGDLLPGNLLVHGGRLTGVIDWAGVGVGDPACDLIIAWGLLPAEARPVFREQLGVDDATWARGLGWGLSLALIAIPYYRDTNPAFAATARHLLDEALADERSR